MSQERNPEMVARLGIDTARIIKVATLLNNVHTPVEGRAAMRQAADILDKVQTAVELSRSLRDTDDLDDTQIVPLCRQMAISLTLFAKGLYGVLQEVDGQLGQP